MNLQNTTGGVSPIKKRGGRSAASATSTGRRRGGFSQHKVGGGLNLGGYNVHTRFKPSKKWTPPSSGGTTKLGDKPTKKSGGGGEKPYSFDKDGKLVFSPTINITNNPTNINKNANVNNPGGGTSSTKTNFSVPSGEISAKSSARNGIPLLAAKVSLLTLDGASLN